MVKRIGGFRRRTRYKLQKPKNMKGKLSLRKYLAEYKLGEEVILDAEPMVQSGMFFPNYQGKRGVVSKKTGSCYEVLIKDGKKEKKLVVHPIHLKRCLQ